MNVGASLDLRMDDTPESFARHLTSLGLSHVEIRHSYLDTRPDQPEPAAFRALAERYGLTYTVHAPYTDCNPANLNERLRLAAADSLIDSLEFAAAVGAGAVVAHGGAVKRGYPEHVHEHAREQAVRTLRTAAAHAAEVGVPLCVENQRRKPRKRYHTATPDRLAALLADVGDGVDDDALGVTLDVGHAKASGVDVEAFLEAVGDRVVVAHLHDNDGSSDDHDPLPGYEAVARQVGAEYTVLEMKSRADIERCVRG